MQYACRKTLADSRPRVRGRFAKNDELCEATRSSSQDFEQYEHVVSVLTILSENRPNLAENITNKYARARLPH